MALVLLAALQKFGLVPKVITYYVASVPVIRVSNGSSHLAF